MNLRKAVLFIVISGLSLSFLTGMSTRTPHEDTTSHNPPSNTVRGWNILSNNRDFAIQAVHKASEYTVNHLQISHDIIMDLKNVRNPKRRQLCNDLTRLAHEQGIGEVVVWDHALYHLDYYKQFRRSKDGKIDLDNPEFWEFLKQDYREMLDMIPEIDGIVLTFIETGAHVEDQYSERMTTEEEKLAAVVDALSEVIIEERNLKLYVRTFIYTKSELSSLLKCLNLIKNPNVIVMTKEAPHDFFLTHPPSYWVKDIKHPVIIEFDGAHEYNGQGIIASIFPEIHLKRWNYYRTLPNVIGYVVRTDRLKTSTAIGKPSEINLYAIKRAAEEPGISADTIYDEFLTPRFGLKALPLVKAAYKKASEVILCSFYTLGTNINHHSSLRYDDEPSYSRHVSGKWLDEPTLFLKHGVNKEFHYWKDIINTISPARFKSETSLLARESHYILDNGWLEAKELMNMEYLNYILTEKQYGVDMAQQALAHLDNARPLVSDRTYFDSTYHNFKRTEITARLYLEAAKAYYGYRIYIRGQEFQTPELKALIWEGLDRLKEINVEMENYPHKGMEGQYRWTRDIRYANKLITRVGVEGWQDYGSVVVPRP